MVETESLHPVAQALKLFGNNGTLIVKFLSGNSTFFQETEPVFAMMDGIPVPFFISSIQYRGNNRAEILFDFIYREAQAKELIGKTFFQVFQKEKMPYIQNNHYDNPSCLIGFTASDVHQGVLGKVKDFFDWQLNPCVSIISSHNAEPFLIPFQEGLITRIDFQIKHITFSLPQGIVEINNKKNEKSK